MRYFSTRGQAPSLSFQEIALSGLAPDGGLYLPLFYPELTLSERRRLEGASYQDIAFFIFSHFCGETFSPLELRGMIDRAYGAFRHPAVAPLKQMAPGHWLLELFHGPTFAFKDIGLRLLAEMVETLLARQGTRATLIGATSGDTGSAALSAFQNSTRISAVILHPKGRVSEIQRRQMTTLLSPEVHNIALEGDFDDAQRIVKTLFSDPLFSKEWSLIAVNSLNWIRIMAQVVYYFSATLSLGARLCDITVPTGNFGNIFAGYVAKRMGAPIRRLIVATNVNDVVFRALHDGTYTRLKTQSSSSPSMDIQVSTNFERLVFESSHRDSRLTSHLLKTFEETGTCALPATLWGDMRSIFSAGRCTDSEMEKTMRETYRTTQEILDPHTAVGYHVAQTYATPSVPMITLATAHPAKFSDCVERACGTPPPFPESLAALYTLPERWTALPAETGRIADFIATHSRAKNAG